MSFFKNFCGRRKFSITFATSCWEKDWEPLLLNKKYLEKQLNNHLCSFKEKILIINNVNDVEKILFYANKLKEENHFTHIFSAEAYAKEVLSHFQLSRSDFKPHENDRFEKVSEDWIYYNALGPLSAIYHTSSDYLLFMTADSYLPTELDWVYPSIRLMEKKPIYKVANPVWNDKYQEAKRESYKKRGDFFIAREGFSDQCFLVKTEDFKQPIYSSSLKEAIQFPRGDVFEKRVYSFMKIHGWKRIIFRGGSYFHENFQT